MEVFFYKKVMTNLKKDNPKPYKNTKRKIKYKQIHRIKSMTKLFKNFIREEKVLIEAKVTVARQALSNV